MRLEMAAMLVPLSSGSVVMILRIKYKGILGTLLTNDFPKHNVCQHDCDLFWGQEHYQKQLES